ncbi:unnamed protein product [Rotaria sp. Silwood1]|nr:unnamed protein product [Rotaria sp. Silwood1]CAF1132422.1 unnamed protein product [Rotaria sp. Silwood1]
MSKQKSTTTVISGAAAMPSTTTITNANNRAAAVLPRPRRRVLQNFRLLWLDAKLDESNDDFKKSFRRLRRVVASIETFKDAQECIDFLSAVTNQKVFMIVSGSLGRQIIADIEAWPQLESVYVFCRNQAAHEQWANKVPKVKGVYTKIKPICQALEIDRENCDRAMISISFNGRDALFMYTQLLKEALLEIEDDDVKSIKDLVEYCRLQDDVDEDEIKKVQREYRNHTSIWWYTAPYFMYSMLNRGLREMDVDIILKMGFFIRHLHQHITELHREQQGNMPTNFQVFRGQGLSMEDFEKMKKTKGGLMSFNNFLSTSRNRKISLENFALPATNNPNSVGILFIMNIDTAICTKSSTPFAEVSKVGYYKDKEEEILFSTHAIFRIDRIERIHDNHSDRLYEVNLTIVGNDNHELNTLTAHIRKDLGVRTGWSRLGRILKRVGEPAKAEQLYQILLAKASSDEDRAEYNYQLGWVYNDMGEYSKALSSYERSLEIRKIALPPNHPDLAASYNNIGMVYHNMGEYSKALSHYEKALDIDQRALPPNHPDLASDYNNIGAVYDNMGEYSKALSSYERSLEIQKIALPPNHPDLASSYEGIGLVYKNMGEYSKALSSYERSLEIKKIALPPNHPDLATSYNGIGLVYDKMRDYSKALSYFEKARGIWEKALPSNHWYISHVKGNIENVKKKM